MSLSLAIKERALEAGFDLVGIAPLAAWKDLEFSRQWVEQGYGGEMRYLENPKREDPRQVLPSAKSVICAGLIYNTPLPYSTEVCTPEGSRQKLEGSMQKAVSRGQEEEKSKAGLRGLEISSFGFQVSSGSEKKKAHSGVPRAWISRYAWGRDYHDVMRKKLGQLRAAVEALIPGVETRVYVDTGPIVERAFARYSGIGWVGKNTCLINEKKGSWFFLGVMLTNLDLEPDLPAPDRCGSCTRCIEACPTGALIEPYVMDASRCIAYFTIELKGSIPSEFRPAIGANVFGCDICQDVCPWNSKGSDQGPGVWGQKESDQLSAFSGQQAKPETMAAHRLKQAATTELAEFQPMPVELPVSTGEGHRSLTPDPRCLAPAFSLFNPPLDALASLSEEDFRRVFSCSPIKRPKYRGWLRNLCVAMGNSSDPRFLPWLERAREHPDPIVREHAEWALEQIGDRL